MLRKKRKPLHCHRKGGKARGCHVCLLLDEKRMGEFYFPLAQNRRRGNCQGGYDRNDREKKKKTGFSSGIT